MPDHDIIRGSVSVKIDVEDLRDFTPSQLSALMIGVGQLVAANAQPIRGQTTTEKSEPRSNHDRPRSTRQT